MAMSTDKLGLLLAELEVEVVQEALQLDVHTRPVPMYRRLEYRYRAGTTMMRPISTTSDQNAVRPAIE